MATKKDAAQAANNGAAARPKVQQMAVDDAFPERDPNIETLILELLEAEKAAEKVITKAEDRVTTAQKSLKEAVRAKDVDKYSSYDIRYVVELKHQDDRLKVRKVKKKEPTPCTAPADD